MANSQSFIDVSPNADTAAKGIIDIINAAAKAKQSQVELQKSVMLDQISRERNRQDKIQEQQDNINAFNSADQGNPATNTTGMANSATPTQVGDNPAAAISPIGGAMPQGGYTPQQPPPMSRADGSNQPQIQAEMAQGQAQQPQMQQQPQQPLPPIVKTQLEQELGFVPRPERKFIQELGANGVRFVSNPKYAGVGETYNEILRKNAQGIPISEGEMSLVHKQLGLEKSDIQKQKQDQQDQKQWTNFIQHNTPDTASPRSTFGIASRSNLQAGRVIKTLKNNPNVTYQDLGNVVADLAGIYAGGAPTDQGMKHQQYESLYTAVQNMKQWATGNPQNAVPEGFKNKILGVAQQTIDLNNVVLNKHFDAQEAAQKKLIEKFPDEWKAFREFAAQDYMGEKNNESSNNSEKTYGGFTIQQAKAKGYKEFNQDTGEWR